ncbi:MAG: HPF/RaiA family ribosome-associated protein [Brumimicrobium sp.]
MEVFFNTDKNIEGKERVETYFTTEIKKDLKRFEDSVTRVEVHLSDENGIKGGANDKKCTIEVRPKGFGPIAATSTEDKIEKAISSATKKIISKLETKIGKKQSVR